MRNLHAFLVVALTVAGYGLALGAAGCAVRRGPAHTHEHCHLVENWKGDRALSHRRVCHSHEHRPDHH
jgi:hypothetical protein